MNNNNNIVQLNVKYRLPRKTTVVKDYLGNYNAAMDLVKQITQFYHSKGYKQVKVWLEPRVQESGRKDYDIRSNIHFIVP